MSSAEERLRHNFAGFTVNENARVHAGDHYTNINNYPSQESPASPVRPFSNVPFPHDPDYIERTDISDEIHRRLVPGARLALVGLGGAGKSQLAVETSHRVRKTSPDTFVFWLHTSNAARLEQSIRNTLEQLQDPGISDPNLSVFQLFRVWLLDRKQERTWMIILDNADDERFLLQPPGITDSQESRARSQHHENLERCLDYLPFCEHGTLLVTSRSRTAALQIVSPNEIIIIGPMDQTDSVALLQRKVGKSTCTLEYTLEELSRLATELEYMPLAMAQAAAYIREMAPRCSVKQYLDKLAGEQTRLDVLGQHTRDLRRDRDAQNCILKTWHITFEHIRQRESSAADLLSLMSFFDRNAIPGALLCMTTVDETVASKPDHASHSSIRFALREFIDRHPFLKLRSRKKQTRQQLGPSLQPKAHSSINDRQIVVADVAANVPTSNLDDDIQILRNYSLVTVITGSPSFDMHRLVQLATQDWLKSSGSFQRWGGHFVMNLDEAFPKGVLENRAICQPLLPHVFAAMNLELHNRNSVLRQASILQKGGMHVQVTGAYDLSHRIIEQAFRSRVALLGPEHESTLSSMQYLAITYANIEQWEKAEIVLSEALDHSKRLWGGDHEFTLKAMTTLGQIYSHNGKLDDAETLQTELLHKARKKHGEEHEDTLVILSDLAVTALRIGRDSEAEEFGNRALTIGRKLYPTGPLSLMKALNSMAIIYSATGRSEEVRQMYHEAFLGRSELLGFDHPDTLTSMELLTDAMYDLGQRQSATDLLRECADLSVQRLGPHHAATVERYKRLRLWEAEDGLHESSESGEETGTDDDDDDESEMK